MEKKVQKKILELEWIDRFSALLDSRFRIPGTPIRFGVDFLLGLIPGIGDIISFAISGSLIIAMVRKGISTVALFKMLWNIFLDALVGSIPILGNIFDLTYRANLRNFELLKEHYYEGEHQGGPSLWAAILMVVFFLIAMVFLLIYLIYKLMDWSWELLVQYIG